MSCIKVAAVADLNTQEPTDGQTALHQCRRYDRTPSSIATAKALLEYGASAKPADREGETLVHAIALAETLEELKLYLDHRVDADAARRRQSAHREALLHYASIGKHIDIVEFLIDGGHAHSHVIPHHL